MTKTFRFAPSPTGPLHIGGLRTALYNWLYSRKLGGKFLLRIEDTDFERSKPEYTQKIIDLLQWSGLNWDEDIVFQASRQKRHQEIAEELVKRGNAYRCYLTPEEISQIKTDNPFAKIVSPWRDAHHAPLSDASYTIRVKSPTTGITAIDDRVQGRVEVQNTELDDMILLRSDGTPTYMLSVVVDDHDMGVDFIIRGDDHLTNTFRQLQIYHAMGWDTPEYAHIPLIHNAEGQKLSKRHGDVSAEHYIKAGYLPEALVNYLLRLGWGGDGTQEILSIPEAIKSFDIDHVSKSPARFDENKLKHINSVYIQQKSNQELIQLIKANIINTYGEEDLNKLIARLDHGVSYIKNRAKTILELVELSCLYIAPTSNYDQRSLDILQKEQMNNWVILKSVREALIAYTSASYEISDIQTMIANLTIQLNIKESNILQVIRAAIIGTFASPGVYEIMSVIGAQECIKRINDILQQRGESKS